MSPEAKAQTIKNLYELSEKSRVGRIESISFDQHDMPTVKYFAIFMANLPKLTVLGVSYRCIDSYRIQFLTW